MNLSRLVAISAMFGALGNVLSLFSLTLGSISPEIAVDLSHIATFSAAFVGGPWCGGLSGALGAIAPFIRFTTGWLPVYVSALIFPGKAMTGVVWGLLIKRLRPAYTVVAGYIPESLFTYFVLTYALESLGLPAAREVILGILAKAWGEIALIAVLAETLSGRLEQLKKAYGLVD